jgi:RNA polymerase sigma factor (sigma-70 family)
MLMVQPHLPLMRRIAKKYVGDWGEDAVQTVLMNAWKVYENGGTITYPRAWLMRSLKNTCFNLKRLSANQPHAQVVDERTSDEDGAFKSHEHVVSDDRSDPFDVLVTREDTRAVLEAVAGLTEPQRNALLDHIARGHGEATASGGERMLVYRARAEVRRKVKFPYAA